MTQKQITNKDLKRRIVEISYKLKLGHIGSCLTAVDIIEEIYKIKKPDEKFVLSAGHAHLAHLVVMAENSNIPKAQKIEKSFPSTTEILISVIEQYGIHCDRRAGCDVSTGSLGHGIGIAVGMALADRSRNVYCLVSDGELAEGSVWEALEVAYQNKLENLKLYINYNGWGAYRKIEPNHFMERIKPYLNGLNIQFHDTSRAGLYDWMDEQIAHYKVLNEQEYNEVMKILK